MSVSHEGGKHRWTLSRSRTPASDVQSEQEPAWPTPTMALVQQMGRCMAILYPKITQNTPQGFLAGYLPLAYTLRPTR